MDYKRIYQNLISKRQQILIEGYTEKHHIIPKCCGGTDTLENIIRLTAREHFIAHLLLIKMYPKNQKLIKAANMMSNFKRYNSKKYEWLKIKWIEEVDHFHTEETKRKISKSQKGISKSESFKQNLKKYCEDNPDLIKQRIEKSIETRIENGTINNGVIAAKKVNTGSKRTEEQKLNLSKSKNKNTLSEESIQKYSECKKGEKNPMYGRKWSTEHREKVRLAKEKTRLEKESINAKQDQ